MRYPPCCAALSDVRLPPFRAARDIGMPGRFQTSQMRFVKSARQQGHVWRFVNGAQRAATGAAERAAGKIRGPIGAGRARGPRPFYVLCRDIDPDGRQRTGMALAHRAGTAVRVAGGLPDLETDLAAQTSTRQRQFQCWLHLWFYQGGASNQMAVKQPLQAHCPSDPTPGTRNTPDAQRIRGKRGEGGLARGLHFASPHKRNLFP